MKKQNNKQKVSKPIAPKPTQRIRGNEVAPYIRATAPQIGVAKDGAIIVRNREIVITYVGTATAGAIPPVVSSAASNFQTGPFTTLWLANIALNYDKYRYKSLKFMYQPLMPTTTSGAVAMYWDPDSNDTVAANYVTCAANYRASTGSIFEPVTLTVSKDQLDRLPWYFTSGTGTTDPVGVASPGQFVIASSSTVLANAAAAGATTLGYIWMEYEIELACPTRSST